MKFGRLGYTICTTLSAAMLLQACTPDGELYDIQNLGEIDPDLHLHREDFERMGHDNKKFEDGRAPSAGKAPPPIPSVAPILAAPRPPQIGETKLVSISVTDDVPLKDVLIELARLAKVDIELDSGIEGGISFIANDKPFNSVVERIANLANLRYSMKNGVLRVERDSPYVESYSMDFLNINRNASASVEISTSVLSAGVAEGGDGFSTGSDSSIQTEVESDFWESLQSNVAMILNYVPDQTLSTIEDDEDEDEDEDSSSDESDEAANRFVVNREAGVITASGTQRQHKLLKTYLTQLRRHMSAQVLIEAKIVEVELFDRFSSGIDWSTAIGRTNISNFFTQDVEGLGETTFGLLSLPGASDANTPTGTGYTNLGGLDVAVQLAESFGTTRTLSSPRLHATNNQQAVLTFAENRIFFDIEVTEEEAELDDNGNVISPPGLEISGEPVAIPIGIILNIIPSINVDTNEVTLNVRPTLSRQVGQVEDPVVSLVAQSNGFNLQNFIPVVEVRELDSIMKMRSGQVMVIGGLMEESSANTDLGVPWFSELPLIGNAFKSQAKDRTKTELIIFIRATVVGNRNSSYHDADRNVYDTFTDDPRPITF